MRARAVIDFGKTEAEFWDMSQEEWNDYCHVGNRSTVMLDIQFAETRAILSNMFRGPNTPARRVEDFRLVKDPSEPDADDVFSAFEALL